MEIEGSLLAVGLLLVSAITQESNENPIAFLDYSLSISVLFGSTKCSGVFWVFSCPNPGQSHFSKEPLFLLVEGSVWRLQKGPNSAQACLSMATYFLYSAHGNLKEKKRKLI